MENQLFNLYTNLYPVQKTLRFSLVNPVGTSLDNLRERLKYAAQTATFQEDQDIQDACQTLKPEIDKIHEKFINYSLASCKEKGIDFSEYWDLFQEKTKPRQKRKKYFEKKILEAEKKLRKKIVKTYNVGGQKLKKHYDAIPWEKDAEIKPKKGSKKAKKGTKKVSSSGIDMLLEKDVLAFLKKEHQGNEKITAAIAKINKFFTVLSGFNQNRKNYYSIDEKSTAIAHRIVNENLPKFCGNATFFNRQKNDYLNAYKELERKGIKLQKKRITSAAKGSNELKEEYISLEKITPALFNIGHFSQCLSQSQIEEYNAKIGNANSIINLYNTHKKEDAKKLLKLKTLFKQIGCGERLPLFFKLTHNTKKEAEANREKHLNPYSVEQVLEEAKKAGETFFKKSNSQNKEDTINTVRDFTKWLRDRGDRDDWEGIYWSKGALNHIANTYFASWHDVLDKISDIKTIASVDYNREEPIKINEAVELKDFFEILDNYNKTKTNDEQQELFKSSVLQNKGIRSDKTASQNLINFICEDIEINAERFIKNADKTINDIANLRDNSKKDAYKEQIKDWMDCPLDICRAIKNFRVKEGKIKGTPIDPELEQALNTLLNKKTADWFGWYDALRNYLTKKPQDEANKLKLYFGKPTIAKGWDKNKEPENLCVVLQKDNKFYLGILNKKHNKIFQHLDPENVPTPSANPPPHYKKMVYKYFKDGRLMIPKCSIQRNDVKNHFKNKDTDYYLEDEKKFHTPLKISKKIFDLHTLVYDAKKKKFFFKKSNNDDRPKKNQKAYLEQSNDTRGYKDAIKTGIDFCKDFLACYKSTKEAKYKYGNIFKRDYDSMDEFYSALKSKIYKISFQAIPEKDINRFISAGQLYLFQIYSKDFSTKSTGRKNLHTYYLEEALKENSPHQLNGEAEIFYRKPVIKYSDERKKKGHHYEQQKKHCEEKKKQFFPILKDKRYSQERFIFHCPITLNYAAPGSAKLKDVFSKINNHVNDNYINNNILPEKLYFLGLDRGEKHLVYYYLIDANGKTIAQNSLNLPFKDRDGKARSLQKDKWIYDNKKWNETKVKCENYNDLLAAAASNRKHARQNWQTIDNIKNLKEGYISKVIHEIINLGVVKNPTFIVQEDLSTGFKKGRQKIEKQVYQKFELALAKKLNFVVDKTKQDNELCSPTNALQLTPPAQNYGNIEYKKQFGIMLYARAGYTSQTDPVTGWRKTIYLKKGNAEEIKKQLECFDDFGFDGKDYYFEYRAKNTGKKWKLWSGKAKEDKILERYLGEKGQDKNEWVVTPVNIKERLDGLFKNFDKHSSLKKQLIKGSKGLEKIDKNRTPWESLRFTIDLIQQIRNSDGKEDSKDNNFLLSPVRDKDGNHFDSRTVKKEAALPENADANGAYNIARKGIIMQEHIKQWQANGKEYPLDLFISDEEWDLWLLEDKSQWRKYREKKNKKA